MAPEKTCSDCKQLLPREAYCRSRSSADGLQSRCKRSNSDRKRHDRLKNPEAVRAADKRRLDANPERRERSRARALEWQRNNPERSAALKRAWYERARENSDYIAREAARQHATRDEKREYDREYRQRRKVEIEAYKASWAAKNREKVRNIKRGWKRRNPEWARQSAKRARQVGRATPPWLSPEQREEIAAIYIEAKRRGPDWHVDHIVPLKGKTVSGLHVPWNLQIIPAAENVAKGNRLLEAA